MTATQPPAPAVVDGGKGPLPAGAVAWLDMGKGEASLTFTKRTDSNRTHKKQIMALFEGVSPGYHALYLHPTPAVQIAAPGDVERETALAELEKWDACIAKSKKIDARACYGGWAIKHRDLILAALRSQGQAKKEGK